MEADLMIQAGDRAEPRKALPASPAVFQGRRKAWKEIWKDVVGYENLYLVSNYGRVKSLGRWIPAKNGSTKYHEGRLLVLRPDYQGYLSVQLHGVGEPRWAKVHRLVAKAFIPNPLYKPAVNHKDFTPANNGVENLEWCTGAENLAWSRKHGRLVRSLESKEKNRQASLGRTNSEETRAKISKATRGVPKLGLRGKPKSEEHKRKISEALRRLPKEVCLRRVASLRGRKHSEETKKRISEGRKAWLKKQGK